MYISDQDFSRFFKEIRNKTKISQETLAEKANVSVKQIRRLEQGNSIKVSGLYKIMSALNIEFYSSSGKYLKIEPFEFSNNTQVFMLEKDWDELYDIYLKQISVTVANFFYHERKKQQLSEINIIEILKSLKKECSIQTLSHFENGQIIETDKFFEIMKVLNILFIQNKL